MATSTPNPWTLTARWIFPADRPPLPRGTITIQGDKILAVESAGTRTADTDLGNVAILPGLVNAHTHLDLSDARGKIPPGPDFTRWLRGVIRHREGRTPEQKQQVVVDGVVESLHYGATLVGDINSSDAIGKALIEAAMRSVEFIELVGLNGDRVAQSFARARELVGRPLKVATCRLGFSPHAPYSTSVAIFERIAQWAQSFVAPVAIHLAETSDEIELIEDRIGGFVDFLRRLGAWFPRALISSIPPIVDLYRNCKPVLWIHANYLATSTSIPADHSIVYCPRTHAAFGHPPHPFREFMKRGVRVVLGTDSLASNPDLDILAEARFVAARHLDLPGETLLRMITLDGAIALGWGEVAGSLTPGKSADLVVLPLPDWEESDPYRLIFDSAEKVQRVLFRGEWR
jgi:aminodeoxyfutalosine deaminase